MTAQHTPGPWAYEVDGSTHNDMRHAVLATSTGLWVAATYRSGTTPEKDASPEADAEAAANALLIAAAPDLLEALQAAVECGMVPTSSAAEGGASKHSRQVQVADMIRAAIARATHKEKA